MMRRSYGIRRPGGGTDELAPGMALRSKTQFARGKPRDGAMTQLSSFDRLSQEAVDRLMETVAYAADHSPYFGRRLGSSLGIRCAEEFRSILPTTAADLADYGDE